MQGNCSVTFPIIRHEGIHAPFKMNVLWNQWITSRARSNESNRSIQVDVLHVMRWQLQSPPCGIVSNTWIRVRFLFIFVVVYGCQSWYLIGARFFQGLSSMLESAHVRRAIVRTLKLQPLPEDQLFQRFLSLFILLTTNDKIPYVRSKKSNVSLQNCLFKPQKQHWYKMVGYLIFLCCMHKLIYV